MYMKHLNMPPERSRRRDHILARAGAAVAGVKMPTGLTRWLANELVTRAGATLLFDQEGDPVPMPVDVLATSIYPSGVVTVSASLTADHRVCYWFENKVRIDGPLGFSRYTCGTTSITV
ncbi:hypothetical protein A2348_01475 [Candidatus Uhrbacteria bacterium RIFOXYB12_FULL_58_10]|uniref:Uncharacterized protein n=1 Tax=Candidatus Uhrbacteria bacterium RIFOXYB2_FULL_57_15 TaxID=1802422 RepID=A0A1F7W5G5_9BACT|nr:MAG: hypothetical protein A2348_01475 [Candidatus Uhrbacteria bacterium RIFOXYB12_FULL_58_10]OGL98053.1 MAG: hypothetical protein A2304_00905 [Candidatus Uhrbacteria bacterium RIFOXYB2_FULL_57_15]OGL99733.1 MAG: hypothetical protein A2501_00245 [Candidatus Uhrbacteria bacterium RIFOXYC12_FULL_57_11]